MAKNRYYEGPETDHFDGERFFNPGQGSTDRSLRQVLQWQFAGGRAAWPKSVPSRASTVPPQRSKALRVTLVGHASVLIQADNCNLLVDPVWSRRASPIKWLGPKRVDAPGIKLSDLPPLDAILITHNHYDHLDLATLRQLWHAHRPRVIAPLGNETVLARAVPRQNIETGDWGAAVQFGTDLQVNLVPAHHWSARSLGDRRMALWCGFLIRSTVGSVYNVGDTGFGDGRIFAEIQSRFGAPDLAILPIGAYEPQWFMKDQHTDPEEAVRIMLACGARYGLGTHWGTFALANESREAPQLGLAQARLEHHLPADRFVAFQPGDVWTEPLAPSP